MKVFLCDGTPESFFTAVFDAYGEDGCVITSDGELQLELGSEVARVGYDAEKCERVRRGIARYDEFAERDILVALRSCDVKKEQICFEYVKRLLAVKRPIKKAFNMHEAVGLYELIHKVKLEVHHLHGFLRFKETAEGAFYAPYSPDNDITDLLMPHFVARFRTEKFVIHDVKREIAALYNGQNWVMARAAKAEICLSGGERAFEALWKKYYDAVNIKERPHEKQMKGSMPVRYWKFLPEKNN